MCACPTKELVERYLNGGCSGNERHLFEEHLTQCDHCREQLEATRVSMGQARQYDSPAFGADTTGGDDDKTVAIDEDERPTVQISKATVELGVPAGNNYVPDPVALYMSSTTDMLYMASGQHDAADYRNSTIYGFTTLGTITRTRRITVLSMHHITAITEDPTTGTLYVVGFNMDNIPQYPDETALPFYEARYAKIPYASTSETAQALAGSHDLAMPMAVLWTKTITCGGANIGGDSNVNFIDFAIIGEYWLNSACTPPNWCGGADIDMSKAVGMTDVAILADNWLQTGCTD